VTESLLLALYALGGAGVVYALMAAGRELKLGWRMAKSEFATNQAETNFNTSEGNDEAKPPRDETGIKRWYEVLEVNAGAELAQIKAAYRAKIALYHPDKVAGLGIELCQLAELRAKEINAAYAIALTLHDHRK
jgi:DnaJ-domain-containing protein 1